jgi:FKBP-type peptidyl-prolyl cis-trans isomerase 2
MENEGADEKEREEEEETEGEIGGELKPKPWQKLRDTLERVKALFPKERLKPIFSKPLVWLVILVAVGIGCSLAFIPSPTVREGSLVEFEWVARDVYGMVVDTNVLEVAEKAGFELREKDYYKPLEIEIGKGQAIEGVEEALLGMRPGEAKKVFIPPEKAYLNKIEFTPFPRYQKIPMVETLSRAEFEEKTGLKAYGLFTTLPHYLGGWQARITNLDGENVTLASMRPRANQSWEIFSGWNAKIVRIKEQDILLKHSPGKGLEFRKAPNQFPWFELAYTYRVEEMDEKEIVLSYNPWEAIAEQGLWFEIKVLEVS